MENIGRFAAFAVKMRVKPTKHKNISIWYRVQRREG